MNSSFPQEILEHIFDYLPVYDMKNFKLVCKSWFLCAQHRGISIELIDSHFSMLLEDLNQLPAFAANIKSIILSSACTGTKDPSVFRSIINCCPNLAELRFESTPKIYNYLMALNCGETVLPSIEKILVENLGTNPLSIKRFQVWINFRFRKTITHLEIFDLESIGALKKYEGLVDFVAWFPNLKYLKAQLQPSGREIVDISSLLKSNSKLETVKLNGIFQVSFNEGSSGGVLSKEATYGTLTKFKLDVAQMSIGFLEFIMQNFTKLNNLRLIVHTIVLPDLLLNNAECRSLLDSFNEYCNRYQRGINVAYSYRNHKFSLNRRKKGKKRHVVVRNNHNDFLDDFLPDDLDEFEQHDAGDVWPFRPEDDVPGIVWPSPPSDAYNGMPSSPSLLDENYVPDDILPSPSLLEDSFPNDTFFSPSPQEGQSTGDILPSSSAQEDYFPDNMSHSSSLPDYTFDDTLPPYSPPPEENFPADMFPSPFSDDDNLVSSNSLSGSYFPADMFPSLPEDSLPEENYFSADMFPSPSQPEDSASVEDYFPADMFPSPSPREERFPSEMFPPSSTHEDRVLGDMMSSHTPAGNYSPDVFLPSSSNDIPAEDNNTPNYTWHHPANEGTSYNIYSSTTDYIWYTPSAGNDLMMYASEFTYDTSM